jgi:hypothetical protein
MVSTLDILWMVDSNRVTLVDNKKITAESKIASGNHSRNLGVLDQPAERMPHS